MSTAPKKRNKANEQIEELTGDLQRLQAEFANYKRRENEARMELLDHAKQDVLKQILPVLDNISRALAHMPEELAENAWANGVKAVSKQTADALSNFGVAQIPTVGHPFDHELHEAISMDDSEGDEEVVIEELQPGYTLNGKVVRHAMVKVGRK